MLIPPMRVDYRQAIEQLQLLSRLRGFDPVVIGTPPLGIAVATSDIDIACCSEDLETFRVHAKAEFAGLDDFQIHDGVAQDHPAVIVRFRASGWDFELFCQSVQTQDQWGVRHFLIEKRLLSLVPSLRVPILQLKRAGQKTEPAFAAALGLNGDPYTELLELETLDDAQLRQLVAGNSTGT